VVAAKPWAANDEVDQRRWVPIDEADRLLTYVHDREMLASLAGGVASRAPEPPDAR